MSAERFYVASVTGYAIRLPYARSGWLRRRQKPATIWYVLDRLYAHRVVFTSHRPGRAEEVAALFNEGKDIPKRKRTKPPRRPDPTWRYDRERHRWVRA